MYQESFWGDREGPNQIAYEVVFRFNENVNTSSDRPYYYTIVSVNNLGSWDEKELHLVKIDIADYISKPDSLVNILNLQSIIPGEINGGVNNGGYNTYDLHEIDVSEFSISEYENNYLSYRTCMDKIEFYNSGEPDVVAFGIEKGDDINKAEEKLVDNDWIYYDEDFEYDHVLAYQKIIDDKYYILALKFSGNECKEWKIFNYSYYPEYTESEQELLKKWFYVPSDINISDYSVSLPRYWNVVEGIKWVSWIDILLEDGKRVGGSCDSITFKPERSILTY